MEFYHDSCAKIKITTILVFINRTSNHYDYYLDGPGNLCHISQSNEKKGLYRYFVMTLMNAEL